jgi:hypothetical protein
VPDIGLARIRRKPLAAFDAIASTRCDLLSRYDALSRCIACEWLSDAGADRDDRRHFSGQRDLLGSRAGAVESRHYELPTNLVIALRLMLSFAAFQLN